MAIVLFHAGAHYGIFIPIGEGRIALFFIVSGFIFWWITMGRETPAGDFLLRRMARLIPTYWLVTVILFGAASLGFSSHQPASLKQLALSLTFVPHFNAAGQLLPVLVPGWTLVFEAFFCVVFAGLLNIGETRRLWILTALFCGLTTYGVLARPTGAIAATYTSPILLEFLAGAWLARLWPRARLTGAQALSLLVGGLLVSWLPIPPWARGFPVLTSGVPALVTVIGALGLERPGLPPIRWLRRLGDSSYAIYLWHIPILIAGAAVCRTIHIDSPTIAIAVTTAAGIAGGLALYEWLERPLTEFLFRALDRLHVSTDRHRLGMTGAARAWPFLMESGFPNRG
jgi:exopolysaccharide production protein ExoZ